MTSRHRKTRKTPGPPPSKNRLAAKITLIYYLALAALIVLIRRYHALPDDGSVSPVSRFTIGLLIFYYYIAPPVLAAAAGIMFRPRAVNFRNVLFTIFIIHVLASFGGSVARHEYLTARRDVLAAERLAEFPPYTVSVQWKDRDGDGVFEQLYLTARVQTAPLVPGMYQLSATVTTGIEPSAGREVFSERFRVESEAREPVTRTFAVDVSAVNPKFEPLAMHADLKLIRSIPLDETGRSIRDISRWMPFFRAAGWGAVDPELADLNLEIARRVSAARTVYRPYGPYNAPIELSRFAGDNGLDTNGDGFMDALEISLDVRSHYSGGFYLKGYLTDDPDPVYDSGRIEQGLQTIVLTIPAKRLRFEAGSSVFTLTSLEISNEDFRCQQDGCARRPLVPFIIRIPGPYTTQAYGDASTEMGDRRQEKDDRR